MKAAEVPFDENDRLTTLSGYKILDTLPEQDFDDITQIASHICSTPIALISLVDESRQWFKSRVGIDASETPRDLAFCAHAILQEQVFVINDSHKDERFHDNPLVTDAPNVRFYAGAPLQTPSGHKIGTLCVIDHEPREMEPAQIEALKALARQVVCQLELRASKEKAEAAANTKAVFLATMSHEIRTPMSGVLSCADLLADSVSNSEDLELVRTIQNSGSSLLKIINDILDFSKIESGKINLESQPFEIRESVEEVIRLLSLEVGKEEVSISFGLDANVPQYINSDITRFQQILINLIGNAIKFTKTKVEINGAANQRNNGDYELCFSIKDDGIGISKEDQVKLFQYFNQVDASTTRQFGGTGLGLAICKRLTEVMGGKVWVESEPGDGAVFIFTIVVKQAGKAPLKDKSTKTSTFNKKMATDHPLQILMAEDNAVNQMIAKKILYKLGYEIDIVSNGVEALEALKKKKYDVILMDQHMPKMDGVEATIKIIHDYQDRPTIIALTASAMKEDEVRCLEAGMDGFLTKPLNINDLKSVLCSIEPKN